MMVDVAIRRGIMRKKGGMNRGVNSIRIWYSGEFTLHKFQSSTCKNT